jgi:hypothetical protein
MGEARSTYGEEEMLIWRFGGETWGKSHLEERGIHGRIILKSILRMWDGSMDWIDVTLNGDRCRDFVNGVINLWVT